MSEPLLLLQDRSDSPTELHDIMMSLKSKLENRISQEFFGATATKSIKGDHLNRNQESKFRAAALKVYNTAREYICGYDFD
jgi:hypothetical protein